MAHCALGSRGQAEEDVRRELQLAVDPWSARLRVAELRLGDEGGGAACVRKGAFLKGTIRDPSKSIRQLIGSQFHGRGRANLVHLFARLRAHMALDTRWAAVQILGIVSAT